MKELPLLVPAGCGLSPEALADQLGRAARLRPAVAGMERSEDVLRVSFGEGVDRALVDELIATEQSCCSFLEVDFDRAERVLTIGADDEQGREVVARLADAFWEVR